MNDNSILYRVGAFLTEYDYCVHEIPIITSEFTDITNVNKNHYSKTNKNHHSFSNSGKNLKRIRSFNRNSKVNFK